MTSTRTWPKFTKSDSPLAKLVALSQYYGSDPDFVLAGGGNTSVKIGDKLYVKASGFALATIEADGFVSLDRARLDALLEMQLPTGRTEREEHFKRHLLATRVDAQTPLRPSIESVLHNLLPDEFIVHTHSTYANMVTCCRVGESVARDMFGNNVLWIPCVDPGFPLAKAVARELKAWQERTGRPSPEAILMQNHGLIVPGSGPDEIRSRTDRVIGAICQRLDEADGGTDPFGPTTRLSAEAVRQAVMTIAPALRALTAANSQLNIVRFDNSDVAISLAAGAEGKAVTNGGPLSPDQIAFSASYPMWFEPDVDEPSERTLERLAEALRAHEAATDFPPKVVLVSGVGMFTIGSSFVTAENARLLYTDTIRVMVGATRLGGVQPLSDEQRLFVENWEVERFRQQVAAGRAAQGRAAGKVALVTGAAQGFGLEIAQDLAAQGACVALADLNSEGAAQAAGEICENLAAGRAIPLAMNVTDPDSIAAAMYQVVRCYGGLDLLVSNAGVLKAGSVKTQPVKDFDFVTAVNYKGYFLCVQNAAPVLAMQHAARPECRGDIIQINSKSGLVGSNRNGAYAGSKFGGIGLTQSFALELIEDGIKVNSICPGNFFDGPLWSDPENGLFVQYLRTGKVPGAKTIEDVRRAYEHKVPMGRGCTTADVMKAIYYLMDQQYETGQALPVTGGQVMLN